MAAVLALLSRVPFLAYPLIVVTFLWLGSRVEIRHIKNADVVAEAKRDKAVADANAKANKAAADLEAVKATRTTRTIYVTRKVKDAQTAYPDWSRTPLPAGVHDAVAEAASGVVAAQPDNAVRTTKPGADDKRGTAGGVRPSPGFMDRLFGPSKGASGGTP